MDGLAARLTRAPLHCDYYDAGRCRSCTLLPLPYDEQLARKQQHCADLLGDLGWLPPVTSPRERFRNKAKLVVGGTVDEPTLGILDEHRSGVDLRDCGLHTPGLQRAIGVLAGFVTLAALAPYDVPTRRGELKHIIATESPDGELMVRFVLRSREAIPRIRKHLNVLLDALPIRVLSVNLQPAHAAILEGEEEIVLTDAAMLPMRLSTGITLQLRPQSFFQTNTGVATTLYATARAWAVDIEPKRVLDLYCGVGGFALHLAGPGREAVGVEVSEQAVESARTAAVEAGVDARFEAADATAVRELRADLVVVNPPRRGIGPDLAGALETGGATNVLYSSCRAETLARDLAAMPSLHPTRAVLLDMFPNTDHYEVLVQLHRR